MATRKQKSQIVIASLLTAAMVGGINTLGALIVYSLMLPKEDNISTPLIAESTGEVTQIELPVPPPSDNTNAAASGGSISRALRRSDAPLTVGQTPQPGSIVTDDTGRQVYRWCSGTNPNLEDGVCEAIISIAANPSENNPHLGPNAKESLALLPRDVSLVMDESSWQQLSSNRGTMYVHADTDDYGTVRLLITLEKTNGIWVLTDGQLA